MPDLQQIDSLLGFIQPFLFYIFSVVALINAIHLLMIFIQGKNLFSAWNKKLFSYNENPGALTEEDIIDIEKEAATSHPLVSNLIKRIRDISSDRKELSLHEIHEIIDPTVINYEIKLNSGASIFIYSGLLFTVAGLLFGIFELQGKIDDRSIKMMLANLEVAFTTTIAGLILSIFPKVAQGHIEKLSDQFRHSFTVFARNELIPRYAVPESERDLNQLVRKIGQSSDGLKSAAESVRQLAENTQVSTSRIENAVAGFSEVAEKMRQREDSLIQSISGISSHLTEMQSTLQANFIPTIETLKNDLLNRDLKLSTSFDAVNDLQAKQAELNKNINSALAGIVDANNQIGKFFNEKFEDSFKKSMDELNQTYDQKIQSIISGLDQLGTAVQSNQQVNTVQQNEHHKDVKDLLENYLNDIKQKVDSYVFPSEEIRDGIVNLKNDLSSLSDKETNEFREIENKNKESIEKIEVLQQSVQKVTSQINVITKNNIEKIKTDIVKIDTGVKKLEKQFKDISSQFKVLTGGKGKSLTSRLFGRK